MHNWHSSESNRNVNCIWKKSSPGDAITGRLWPWERRRWWPKAQHGEGLRQALKCLSCASCKCLKVEHQNISSLLEGIRCVNFPHHACDMCCFPSKWACSKIEKLLLWDYPGPIVSDNWGWAEQSLCDFVWFTFLMLVAFSQKALHLSCNYFPYLFLGILMDWCKILKDPMFACICARCMHIVLLSYGHISLPSQQRNLE